MSTIRDAESWLIAVLKDTLGSDVDVASGPGEYDGEYLNRFLTQGLACRVVWNGGETGSTSTSLTIQGSWTILAFAGWRGTDQDDRRRNATEGAYQMVQAIAARLHNESAGQPTFTATGARVQDAEGNDLEPVEGAGHIQVTEIVNEWSGELNRVDLCIYSIELQQDLPIELEVVSGALNDWRTAHIDYNIPEGEDVDLQQVVDLPQ
ncbi:MAG: DUF1834 family protein [Rhodospirillales bacterium]|nr:DUF1834 family protein [Rhodospirillales bacterium]